MLTRIMAMMVMTTRADRRSRPIKTKVTRKMAAKEIPKDCRVSGHIVRYLQHRKKKNNLKAESKQGRYLKTKNSLLVKHVEDRVGEDDDLLVVGDVKASVEGLCQVG